MTTRFNVSYLEKKIISGDSTNDFIGIVESAVSISNVGLGFSGSRVVVKNEKRATSNKVLKKIVSHKLGSTQGVNETIEEAVWFDDTDDEVLSEKVDSVEVVKKVVSHKLGSTQGVNETIDEAVWFDDTDDEKVDFTEVVEKVVSHKGCLFNEMSGKVVSTEIKNKPQRVQHLLGPTTCYAGVDVMSTETVLLGALIIGASVFAGYWVYKW